MGLRLFSEFCDLLPEDTASRVRKSFGAQPGHTAAGELTLQEWASTPGQIGPDILAGLVARGEQSHAKGRGVVYTEPAEARLVCQLALVHVLAARLGRPHEPLLLQLVFDTGREDALAALTRAGLAQDAARFLRAIRVLDPACGAGTLLVTMFSQLDALLALLDPDVDTSTRRARIIERCLFGTDIDPWALTVTRLRLSLAARGAVDGASDFRLLRADCLFSEFDTPFDVVIGNPPYVRHERISDPMGALCPAEYKSAIAQRTTARLPHVFARHKLSRACDLYAYFYFLGLALLKEDGALCFVSSSSWLDVGFAASLRGAAAEHLSLLIDHDHNRSFDAADVNTVIAVLSARPTGGASIVRVQVPFAQLEPEHLATPRRVTSTDLACHAQTGWGARFLRAPALFSRFTHNMRPLGAQFAIGRGRRTGNDAFFYPTADDVNRFAIEPRFLRPLVKSPSEFAEHRQTNKLTPRRWLFMCRKPIGQLAGTGAAAYIAHAKVSAHKLGEQATPDLLLPIAFHDRYFVAINNAGWEVHQRFATLRLTREQEPLIKATAAILSGNVLALFAETMGRHSLGQGALDIPPRSWQMVPFPDLTRLTPALLDELASLWDTLAAHAPKRAPEAAVDPTCQRIDQLVCELADVSSDLLGDVVRDRLVLLEKRLAKAVKKRPL